jgi:hypothetical protein
MELSTGPAPPAATVAEGPEWLGQGLFDVTESGQIQTSASLVKIYVGEPGGFRIPFYLLTGTTSSALSEDSGNEATVWDLISQTGGLASLATNLDRTLWSSQSGITILKGAFAAAGKIGTGSDPASGDAEFFGAGYVDGGLVFQTGAWQGDDQYRDGGIAWLQARYAYGLAGNTRLEELFGPDAERPHGVRIDGGIFIQGRINVKVGVFLAVGGEDLPNLDGPALRFSFDYKVAG